MTTTNAQAAVTKEQVRAQVELFVPALQEFCNQQNTAAEIYSYVITAEFGPKNIRIVRRELWKSHGPDAEPTNGSVHCFIDAATGNILKADGWKRPAKGIRGSIFAQGFDLGRAVTQYGAAYAR
jgi:hypothetical protein